MRLYAMKFFGGQETLSFRYPHGHVYATIDKPPAAAYFLPYNIPHGEAANLASWLQYFGYYSLGLIGNSLREYVQAGLWAYSRELMLAKAATVGSVAFYGLASLAFLALILWVINPTTQTYFSEEYEIPILYCRYKGELWRGEYLGTGTAGEIYIELVERFGDSIVMQSIGYKTWGGFEDWFYFGGQMQTVDRWGVQWRLRSFYEAYGGYIGAMHKESEKIYRLEKIALDRWRLFFR